MKKIIGLLCLISCACVFIGCKNKNTVKTIETGETSDSNSYNSIVNTNVILHINPENMKIELSNINSYQSRIYEYSGATDIKDKFGDAIAISQLSVGDIVNIDLGEKDIITRIYVPSNINEFEYSGQVIRDKDIGSIEINGQKYKCDDNILIFSDENKIDFKDLYKKDILDIKGIGNQIYSIVVTKGHGFVKLDNNEKFIGGFIEVGKEITQITANLKLTVPEGVYILCIANKGYGGSKEIEVNRNEEVIVDASELYERLNKHGVVTFNVIPAEAQIDINGQTVTTGEELDLDYGIYRFVIRAEGYDNYSANLFVHSEKAKVDINMDEIEESSTEETKENEKEETSEEESSEETNK